MRHAMSQMSGYFIGHSSVCMAQHVARGAVIYVATIFCIITQNGCIAPFGLAKMVTVRLVDTHYTKSHIANSGSQLTTKRTMNAFDIQDCRLKFEILSLKISLLLHQKLNQ